MYQQCFFKSLLKIAFNTITFKFRTYIIKITSETDTTKMNSLKELLLENRGETEVELHLLNANKKIKLPFGVNLTEKLKQNIDEVLV